jgi:hypothetical protein
MDINSGVIVQGVMVAVLVGVGKAVWNASVAIAKLGASFEAHTKTDETFQKELRDEVREVKRAINRRRR